MELKSGMENDEGESGGVLIVPLWNWNKRARSDHYLKVGSNCTFMELKYRAQYDFDNWKQKF